ncbi:MFS transporter [Streptomyces sp. x-80]|uniref:MFS transporter n=1 Tax=Streptomyces sp. x-80 TaxID=2789282 RepID=UPI00397EFEE3
MIRTTALRSSSASASEKARSVSSSGLSPWRASRSAGPARDRAYALGTAVHNAASVAGPAAVSVLAELGSPGPAVLLLAGAAALVVTLPYGRTRPAVPAHPPASLLADLAAGLAVVLRTPELRAITAATCLAHIGIGAPATTTVLLAEGRGRPGGGGVLMTAFAAGALAGALAVGRWPPPVPVEGLARPALFGTGLALAAAALVPAPAACAVLTVPAGLFDGPLPTATLRIRADHAPPRLRAQVFLLGAGLKISAAACGAALAGLATALPAPLLLLGIAALQPGAALLHTLARLRPPRGPGTPSAAARRPETAAP